MAGHERKGIVHDPDHTPDVGINMNANPAANVAGLGAGGELAGEVGRWRPRVVARARCCWRVLG
jgi:hypothetical protein